MKTKLCDVNPAALDKLPHLTEDKSGIGVHYVDAFLKPMNAQLPDGSFVKCKRRGLKIALSAGGKKGEGLMRRLDVLATRSSCSRPRCRKRRARQASS